MFSCDQLVCLWIWWIDFLLPTITTQLFPQSLGSVLKILSSTRTSVSSGAAVSIKLAPVCFAAGIAHLPKNGKARLKIFCASDPHLVPVVDQNFRERKYHLIWHSFLVASYSLEMNVGGLTKHQIVSNVTTRYKSPTALFRCWCLPRQIENRKKLTSGLDCRLIRVWWFFLLSDSYYVFSCQLWMKRKTTQQGILCVDNSILLN